MPIRPTAKKVPIPQYVCLGLLFLAAAAYQVRFTEARYPAWFGNANAVRWPFFFLDTDTGPKGVVIGFLSTRAAKAGLKSGDLLLAVNGKPVTGTAVYGEALAQARPGDRLRVEVRSPGNQEGLSERTAEIELAHWVNQNPNLLPSTVGTLGALLFVVTPAFCLVLGFWVAAVRPRDLRAWLLLGVMLGFTAMMNPTLEAWGRGTRDLAMIYHVVLVRAWPILMLLFGIYFPEPFPEGQRWPWWNWLKWLLGVPLVLFGLVSVVTAVGDMENLASVLFLHRLLTPVGGLVTVLPYVAVGGGFACLGAKARMTVSPDAKRRLRLLYAGGAVSFAPYLLLLVIAAVRHKALEEYFPYWLALSSYVMMFLLFPLTLAYGIVVQRAMDVRVVIRQGLQYAFAKGGIVALRLVIFGALGIGLAFMLRHSGKHNFFRLAIIGAGVMVGSGLGSIVKRLKAWTDRRFFRDAYNAELILADLGEKVRTMVEARPLLETVATRIAESLHVPCVAVLLDGSGPYRPAYALGYGGVPEVAFNGDAGTVRRLREEREPARVYFDDPNSWINRAPDVTDEERAKLAKLQTELLLPLSMKDKLLGFISLSQKRSEEPYSGTDLRLLKSVAAQTGMALENARLTAAIAEEVAQRERLNREVEIAREVQERLFPQKLPPVPGLDYAGTCRPALGVGGDYYDFVALPGGRLGIALGDVSGKGIAAALVMASLQASLRSEASRDARDLAAIVTNVHRLVYEATSANHYATFFYAQYDPASRRLDYVNAGHNPPMLFRKSDGEREIIRLDVGGTVIGLLDHLTYEQATVELGPGDLLLAFTDGVTESLNSSEEEWGEDRLLEAVRNCDSLPAGEMVARILNDASAFAGGAKQYDDMTLVVLRCVR